MILNYDMDSLALVYLVTKIITEASESAYTEESFFEKDSEQWYSVLELNQIINN